MLADPAFHDALARLRDVLAFYRQAPDRAATSLELEDCTRDAARAGLAGHVPFAAVCAELGRAATETIAHDRLGAIMLGRIMTRWAAEVYHQHATSSGGRGVDA
jgi:hypothetical protein